MSVLAQSAHAAHRVYRIGADILLDSSVSWCPDGVTRTQSVAGHLIVGPHGALLVDTGLRAHAEEVLGQLATHVPPGMPMSVLLTRTEMECCLNLPAIEQIFPVDEVWYTGGITVPRTSAAVRRVSVAPGESLTVEPIPGIEIELISPHLRLLPTLWVYHAASGALLTSDAFTYGHEGSVDPEDGLVKFTWIRQAESGVIAEDIVRVVEERDVTALCPTYGEPFVGADACAEASRNLARAVEKWGDG